MIYQKHPDMVSRRIMDEVILVPIQRSTANMNSIFTLNETAAFVWDLIDGEKTEAEIAEALAKEHHVETEQARKDLAELLSQLEEVQAVLPKKP